MPVIKYVAAEARRRTTTIVESAIYVVLDWNRWSKKRYADRDMLRERLPPGLRVVQATPSRETLRRLPRQCHAILDYRKKTCQT